MTTKDQNARWRPLALAVIASLALHGGLLIAVTGQRLPAERPAELIRLTLIPAGGRGQVSGGSAVASAAPMGSPMPSAQPPAVAAVAEVERRAVPPPAPVRAVPKIKRPAKAKPAPPAALAPIANPEPAPVVASIPPAAAGAVTSGGGQNAAGLGSGQGSGTGDGSGQGGGRGGGSGGGAGGGINQRGHCVSCPEPSYPLLARARGWEGTVDVDLVVEADGSVNRVSVRRSSGYDVLDRAAVRAAETSRFRPPMVDGEGTRVEGFMTYRFQLAQKR